MTTGIGTAGTVAAVGYAAAVGGLLVAPALVLTSAGDRGGVSPAGTADVVAVSAAIAGAAAVLAWRRAYAGDRTLPLVGRWSAALAALGVLAPLAAALPALALRTVAWLPAEAATRPWLTPAVWGASLGLAVLGWVGVHRAVRRWLTPAAHDRRSRARRPAGSVRSRRG